ncbi:ROK family protein [Cohnella soli]|uniref:ROK family protein n=1 Tax=Cohnella soli TaxID=425005 RepID=A0ABW0HXF7_9BACL
MREDTLIGGIGMGYRIGMAVGVTYVIAGLFGPDGRLLRREKRPTVRSSSSELLAEVADIARDLLAQEGVDNGRLDAVGIGLPGFIESDTGLVTSANLPFGEFPVASRLRHLLDVPITVHNDVKMTVYGESLRGAGRGYAYVLGVTLGTGMSSTWISNGKLHEGNGGLAGEIGHIRFPDISYACGCGMIGCLETVVSSSGIARQAREGLAAGWIGPLADRFPLELRDELTAIDVLEAYHAGDAFAAHLFQRTAKWLARALVPTIAMLSPDLIIIGGGVAAAGEVFFEALKTAVADGLHPLYRERLLIVPSQLGEDAGVYGSAEYAVNAMPMKV